MIFFLNDPKTWWRLTKFVYEVGGLKNKHMFLVLWALYLLRTWQETRLLCKMISKSTLYQSECNLFNLIKQLYNSLFPPLIMLTTELRKVTSFEHISQSKLFFVVCSYLHTWPSIHSNIGVCSRWIIELGPFTL